MRTLLFGGFAGQDLVVALGIAKWSRCSWEFNCAGLLGDTIHFVVVEIGRIDIDVEEIVAAGEL